MMGFFKKAALKIKSIFKSGNIAVFFSLVKLQLKDKIDLSFVSNKKKLIQNIVFSIIGFLVVGAVSFGSLYVLKLIALITFGEVCNLLVTFTLIYFILDLFGTSFELMKNLYLAEDNKLLVTYPVSAGGLFLSKLVVYFVFELRKSLKLYIPVVVGFVISMLTSTVFVSGNPVAQISFLSLLTMFVTFILISAFTVVFAALLSVPFLYIYSTLKRMPILELVFTALLVAGFITLCVLVIKAIPEEIIIQNWINTAANTIKTFVTNIGNIFIPFSYLIYLCTGTKTGIYGVYQLNPSILLVFLIYLASLILLSVIVYFVIKPFYFHIICAGSEFDNSVSDKEKSNRVLNKYITFSKKELIISIRDVDISGNYIAVYILVPILLMFIDAIYSAISVKLNGQTMTLAFNLLLILTPLLASNSLIASMYSKEGRAAYIKKTKPVDPLIPLGSKLLFNLVLSVPSIVGCSVVFGNFSHQSLLNIILLGVSVLLIQYAHIFFSASLDIMNPLNEQYATDGNLNTNPNENISVVVGFVGSIVISVIFYLLLTESNNMHFNFTAAFIKLFVGGLVAFFGCGYLFIKKIKAYYYEK